jgi:hypothetical protein
MSEEPEEEKIFNDIFKSTFSDYIKNTNPPSRVPKNIVNIQNYAAQLFFEDSVENQAAKGCIEKIIIYPDIKKAGKWVVYAYPKAQPASRDPVAMMLGSASSRPLIGYYNTFEQADAWMEKNKYFGMKTSKYEEGIYASWN